MSIDGEPTLPTDQLRRRMLIGYLILLAVPYSLAVAQSYWIDRAPSDARGEILALVVCATGLLCCIPNRLARWRYVMALTCVIAAPVVAMLYHRQLAGQSWSVVPLMFAAMYVRTWHRPAVARVVAVVIWIAASIGLLAAPADVPILWLICYGVSIIGAAEVFGVASSALVNAALRDPLTAVWNRAGVDRHARRIFAQARRRGEPVAVIVLDFDDFKRINDRDGHAAGDTALAEFTRQVLARLPKSAVFGRLGGDEFVVILSDYDAESARGHARMLVDGHRVPVSFGVATGPPVPGSLAELFDAADADLYRHKRARKNSAGVAE